ncbi:hypothetical protein [Listeria fleischmannii]|nr:hypothetical protein [Listeria fleischmannii]
MDNLFTPDEFINAIRDTLPNAINEKKLPANMEIPFNHATSYIIKSGTIAGYISRDIESKSSQLYSFFSKGDFILFGQVFDDFSGMTFETLAPTSVYSIKQKDLQYLLHFPENSPFLYYIMKRFGVHYYLKSHLSMRVKENVLIQAIFNICFLRHPDLKEFDRLLTLPKEYTASRIKEYSTLSQAGFYKHLKHAYEQKLLLKSEVGLQVDLERMEELYPSTIPKKAF